MALPYSWTMLFQMMRWLLVVSLKRLAYFVFMFGAHMSYGIFRRGPR